MQSRLIDELTVVGRRLRISVQLTVLALIWLTFFLVAWGLVSSGSWLGLEPWILALGFLGISLVASLLFCLVSRNWFSDLRWLACRVEARYPDLDSRLLTSLDQLQTTDPRHLGFLQHLVLMETVSHSARHRWDQVVSPAKVVFSRLAAALGFLLLLIGAGMLATTEPQRRTAEELSPIWEPQSTATSDLPVELIRVEPGNTEVEKGTTLTVLARFRSGMPESAELVYELATGINQETGADFFRIPMSASFDDPVFAGQIDDVRQPLTYWIEYGEQSSDRYYATVFEYPELQQLDFELDFPDYSGMPDKTINDARRLSALRGTEVRIIARLNKSVEVCELVSEEYPPIRLIEQPGGEPIYVGETQVEFTARYQLRLRDASQRENRLPPEIQITVLENEPPQIKVTLPGRDMEVSPLEELETAAKMSDDFGLQRAGIAYSIAGQPPEDIVLGEQLAGRSDHELEHLLAFEQLGVQPRQMVSYYFWAEDLVAEGQTRRVMSDMFFAEVREFEQIFRQGQQNGQQQQSSQQSSQNQAQQRQMGELLQLQKEIINATWKLIRRETDESPSAAFPQDVSVIQESQQSAMDLVDQAVQRQNSPEAAALGTEIKSAMNNVILTLQTARDENSATPLVDAVTQEQMVYQMILRLGSNENQVQQQQSQSGSSSGQQNRSQQQLQQLQLSNDRNRYEQENQAQLREEEQQSEMRQALNRLKELARRQEDINQQLEQLQTALEEAQSEQEKEEIERRLKRLREQQEDLLRDLDELKEQAEQNQNNELMQSAKEQLEAARENVRRSAESLKENQVSQAAAAGNRAQKQFEDLREEFRKSNANQFADQMQEMKDQADELKSRQDEIAQRLQAMDEDPQKSLREKDDRQEISQELLKQREKYDAILEDIKEVVRQAEETEPLLSQELYDTFRDSSRSATRESIETTENLLSRGFLSEARNSEQAANEGISQLNERIRQAAESIVGDETDSLRRAEQSLRELSEQINNEIARNTSPNRETDSTNEQRDDQQTPAGESTSRPTPGSDAERQADAAEQKSGNRDPANDDPDSGEQPNQPSASQPNSKSDSQSSSPKKSPGSPSPSDSQSKSKSQSQQGAGKAGDNPGKAKSSPSEKKSDDPNPADAGSSRSPGSQPAGQPSSSGQSQTGQQPSGQPQGGQQPSEQQQGDQQRGNQQQQQSGQQASGKNASSAASGQREPSGQRSPARAQPGSRDRDLLGGYEQMFGPSAGGDARPLTGDEYRQFSNELRNIEELLDDPEMRSRAAQIREKAKEIRVEMKRHSKQPNWDIVQDLIAEPLENLRADVARELLLKENREALVPIDRDPVPTIFEDQVREYYKELSEVNQ